MGKKITMNTQDNNMKVICAWCDREMGTEEGSDEIRYSVCRQCLAKFNIYPEEKYRDLIPESK
jgi:uncharacterized CHY-type Zn-finger protein